MLALSADVTLHAVEGSAAAACPACLHESRLIDRDAMLHGARFANRAHVRPGCSGAVWSRRRSIRPRTWPRWRSESPEPPTNLRSVRVPTRLRPCTSRDDRHETLLNGANCGTYRRILATDQPVHPLGQRLDHEVFQLVGAELQCDGGLHGADYPSLPGIGGAPHVLDGLGRSSCCVSGGGISLGSGAGGSPCP